MREMKKERNMTRNSITRGARAVLAAFAIAAVAVAATVSNAQQAGAGADNNIAADDFIVFNFEQVDVRVFTQVIGNFTGEKFVVADEVKGVITVVSPKIPRSSAFKLFASVLESSGFTIIKDGEINRIVRLQERKAGMGEIISGNERTPEYGLVTRIILLSHVTASEMRKMLEIHLQRKDSASALDETNHLIITDTAEAVRRVEQLVAQLDKPGMARIMEIVPLLHADAVQLARQLNLAHAESFSRAGELLTRIPPADGASPSSATRPPLVVAAEHANRLILTGTQRQVEQLKLLIAQMDIPAPTGRSALNAIVLNFVKAEDVAKNISALLDKTAAQTPGGAGATRRAISVEAVVANNALIVDAAPEDFASVKRLVETLDVMPRHVHISVLIAEVADGDAETLGVTMTALNAPNDVGKSAFAGATRGAPPSAADSGLISSLSQGMFGQGLTFGIARGAYKDANGNIVADYPGIFNIDAIRKNSKVKILSDTSLGAQDNHKAEVAIVDNIGILESTVNGSGADRDIIQNITRQDVGVKVNMIPHIIPGGLVRVELEPSIEAVTDSGSGGSAAYVPTISKRSVKTTMTVPDGQTIVIAGLTRNDETVVKKRIPLLGDIPLLGWLFRWNSSSKTRTNILIFVTPRVLEVPTDAVKLREELEAKTGLKADYSDLDSGTEK